MAIGAINGYENYNYFKAKPVNEREARPVYGNENFFVNPPSGYTAYVPEDLFSGHTAGLSGLVAGAANGAAEGISIQQNLPAQAGYNAGVTTRSWIG